jgi:serine/threonine-protein kinase
MRRYRLIAEIGHGGMADVYLAVAQGPAGFNKLVVVKKTRRDLITEADILAMFLDEARLAARLNHPNVVQTLEIGQDGDRYFIAMEYLDGQPYNRLLSRASEQLPLPLQLRILIDVLSGLHHAHELKDFDGTPLSVVHRDATPQNVFITYDGSIKVVDFGIAKAVDSSSQTRTGVVKGKVAYMAPEQVRGERLDRRTDVFAVGVMLWEAIAKRRMWEDLPEITVVHELMHNLVPGVASASADVSPELAAICDRAVAPIRDHRYQTALELQQDLEEYLARERIRASARDVGAFVADVFAADREKVRKIIEAQLKDVRWSQQQKASMQDLPSIEINSARYGEKESSFKSGADEPSFVSAVSEEPSFRRQETERIVTSPSMIGPTDPLRGPPSRAFADQSTTLPAVMPPTSAPTNSGAALPMPAPRPPEPRQNALIPIVFAVVATIALFGVGVKLIFGSSSRADAPAPEASAVVAKPAETSAPAAESVRVTIRVEPKEAAIYLDDVLIGSGSFEGKLPRSDAPRRLRLRAEGYVPREERLAFLTDSVALNFELTREEEPAPPTTAPPRPAAGGRAAPKNEGKGKAKHDIDSESPYGR